MLVLVIKEREDKDQYRALVEWYWQGKTDVLGENPVKVSLSPPRIPDGLAPDRTRFSMVKDRLPTTWSMAEPERVLTFIEIIYQTLVLTSQRTRPDFTINTNRLLLLF